MVVNSNSWTLAGEGVVDHGDDRLKEGRKKDRNMWFLTEHCFFLVCLFVVSKRNIASDWEGALKQVRYMHHIYVTPNLKSEYSTFEGLIKEACASSGELKLATSLKYSVPMD